MRSESLARKLQYNSPIHFWKEIKRANNCKTSSPTNIDGVSGLEEITQWWQTHFYELFSCVKSNSFTVGNIDSNEDVTVLPQEIYDAIMMPKDNRHG